MQEEDPTLQKLKQLKGTETRKGYVVSYEKREGTWYQIRQRKDDVGDPRKQILVPKSLRRRVMGVAHNSLFGGHLGVKKMEDRVQTNFFLRMLPVSVGLVMFVARGSVPQAPLGDMSLVDQPFKRVAIDLVGAIAPASDKGHRYILTLVDYATRYPEAVLLKNINTKTVAEALLDMYSRVGIPEEVLSDLGTQFTSDFYVGQWEVTYLRIYVVTYLRRSVGSNSKSKLESVGSNSNLLLELLPTDQNKLLTQWKGPFEIKGTKWGNNYQVEVIKKVKTYHINMLKLYMERGRIEETALPGRRDIPGEPRRETQVGCGGVQGGHPQAAAVGQVGTNLVKVKKDVAEEVSINEELLGLVTFQSKESIQGVSPH